MRDKKTNEIAAYFSLRTGSFTPKKTTQDGEDESKNTVSSVELSNLAVNSAYREQHPEAKRLGERVFRRFIIPAVRYGAELFGIQPPHIYALLDHYGALGSSRLPPEMEG